MAVNLDLIARRCDPSRQPAEETWGKYGQHHLVFHVCYFVSGTLQVITRCDNVVGAAAHSLLDWSSTVENSGPREHLHCSLQTPDNDSPIDTTRANLAHSTPTFLITPHGSDSVLMHTAQLRVILARLSLKIHLPEHVQRALLPARSKSRPLALLLQAARQLPARLRARKAIGFAVVTGADDFALRYPDEVCEGQELRGDGDDGCGWLFWS